MGSCTPGFWCQQLICSLPFTPVTAQFHDLSPEGFDKFSCNFLLYASHMDLSRAENIYNRSFGSSHLPAMCYSSHLRYVEAVLR